MFNLPSGEVYLAYDDGTQEECASADDLSREEATQLKLEYEKYRKGKRVIQVSLLIDGVTTACYNYA